MTRERDLLRAVLAAPDDDAPRRVYADWCAENGDPPRAEFILAQCELAREEPYSRRWRALGETSETLRNAFGAKWAQPLRGTAHHQWYARGFVETVSLALAEYEARTLRALELAPVRVVRPLEFRTPATPAALAALAASPATARLEGLEVQFSAPDAPIEALFATPGPLRAHRSLVVRSSAVGAARVVRALARYPFERLASLAIATSGTDDDAFVELLASPALGALRSLRLAASGAGDRAVLALASAPHLASLERFDASYSFTPVTDDAVVALAAAPHLARLRALALGGHHVGDAAVRAIAASAHLRELRELRLTRTSPEEPNPVTSAGVVALAASPNARNLRALDLANHRVDDEGAAAILASPHLEALGVLDLSGVPIRKELRSALRKRYGPGVCTFTPGPA